MPRRKISKRKSIVRKLDKIVSLIIRKTTPYCVVCGTTQFLQNGHLFSITAYNTRWDISEDVIRNVEVATLDTKEIFILIQIGM